MASTHTKLQGKPVPVEIPVGEAVLHGELQIPEQALGLVIFIHGGGSNRFSPRNMHVASDLNKQGLATLLLDLLSKEEQEIDSETSEFRFNIPLLGSRSTAAAKWALSNSYTKHLPVGLFGASTGAAAALITASALKEQIAAVVSRGGRPDLAGEALAEVVSPTLLIVGSEDKQVLDLNRRAVVRIAGPCDLRIVQGATHLFEEAGALAQVTTLAAEWFAKNMKTAARHKGIARLQRA